MIASDPGLLRLRVGLRASLVAAATTVVVSGMAGILRQPPTLTLVAVLIAMITTVVVTDANPGQELVTFLLAPLVAAGAVLLATLVRTVGWERTAASCVVIFAAVLARQLGPRGSALGVVAFMAYFVALYLGVNGSHFEALGGALGVTTAIVLVMRFWVVPEPPQEVVTLTLRAFRARAVLILTALTDPTFASVATSRSAGRRRRRMLLGVTSLNEIALALDDQAGLAAQPPPAAATRVWATELLEVDVAVEALADAYQELERLSLSEDARRHLTRLSRALARVVGRRSLAAGALAGRHLAAVRALNHPDLGPICPRIDRAVRTLTERHPWDPPAAVRARPQGLFGIGMLAGPSGALPPRHGIPPYVQLAIQATVAGALAIAVGRRISSERWFWAVVTAFVVFIRATTVGETMRRAWQRVLGTVAGVVGGALIAHVVGAHRDIALVLIYVCIFAAYYFIRVSYPWMVAFITGALALVYTVLGRYSSALLVVRLEETIAGAAIGLASAALIFPSRSSTKIRSYVAEVLRKAASAITVATAGAPHASVGASGSDAGDATGAVASVREMDRAYQALWQVATPVADAAWPAGASRLTRPVDDLAVLAFAVRHLVSDQAAGPIAASAETRAAGERLAARCRAVAGSIEDRPEPPSRAIEPLDGPRTTAAGVGTDPDDGPARAWLARIDRSLATLEAALGRDPA